MAQSNVPLIAFNRGVISDKALARTDIDRTRMSASKMTNWIPKTTGAMTIRPGTKYIGSSLNDTGAEWIEFAASTLDTAMLEMTPAAMRVWDSGDVLISRPKVDTTLTLSDTGWANDSIGGGNGVTSEDVIPTMTGATTNGVTITASTEEVTGGNAGWKVGDDDSDTAWFDTGAGGSQLPSWVNVDFGLGNSETIETYTVRAGPLSNQLDNAPTDFHLIGSTHDTGTYATDTGKWTSLDEQSSQTGWAIKEQREFSVAGAGAHRHIRLYVSAVDGDTELIISELELFSTITDTGQVIFSGGGLTLNAGARGALARAKKEVVVSDTGTEHSIAMHVSRGPVRFMVGSSDGEDDYVSETTLGTGYHNLAFTPLGNFHVTVQSDKEYNRVVNSMTIGDSGTLEVTTPYTYTNKETIRTTQSADVVYVAASGEKQHKIERRGSGRSWSVVEYEPSTGPFLAGRTSSARLKVNATRGNTNLVSDIPFFSPGHVGALFRLTTDGQDGNFVLGADEATTDVITITGISDTGTPTARNERRITFDITGTYKGTIWIERSFDDPEYGFHIVTAKYVTTGDANDTGTFSCTVDDGDDNVTVFYRARMANYTDGAAEIAVDYDNGATTGIVRVTDYQTSEKVGAEVLSQLSKTSYTEDWEEGAWSDVRGYPTSAALHEGRLFWGGNANLWGSVSDDYENYDDLTDGDAAPINKTLGSGPVDNVYYLVSLLRLVLGTSGSELAVKSSSLDEPLTPTNSTAKPFSTQGSANIRALPMDTRMLMVQRSKQRVFSIGFGETAASVSDYDARELTVLVPDLMKSGIKSIAIQRQPDTRLHCVLEDGRVAIMTYEPQEEVLAWSMWQTDTGSSSVVEKAMVLPGEREDRIYYHIQRTINGSKMRYLEKWALEDECAGDTGLSWLADCAVSFTADTGRAEEATGFDHLIGQSVVGWANDTGQNNDYGKDLTPDDTGGDQVLLSVDTGGNIVMGESVKHFVGGLPFDADYKSTKLAYAAELGSALTQMKRVDRLGFLLYMTHNNAIKFGNDTGNLDPMPRTLDEGTTVDADKIFDLFDDISMPFPGLYNADSRVHVKGKAPRPATILGMVPSVKTNEKV